jgi:uncharacterized repeat protein (TIGR02543 family)
MDEYAEPIDPIVCGYGETIELPKAKSWGLNFEGWYTSKNVSGRPVTGPVTVKSNLTYYAKWSIKRTCHIRIEPNGGKYLYSSTWRTEPTEFDIKFETAIGNLRPSKADCTFDGYYLDADFTNPWNIKDVVDDDITIYFKWKTSSSYGNDPEEEGEEGIGAVFTDKVITMMMTNKDLKVSEFGKIQLRSSKQTKESIKLNWKKPSGAVKTVVYGSVDGNSSFKKIGTFSGTSTTVKKIGGSKLVKGKYYKFIAVALDKNDKAVSISKVIHVATSGGKVGNHKKVTVKAKVDGKTKAVSKVTVNKGKTLKLNATAVPAKKKLTVKEYEGVRFESSNKKVATVTSTGKITAKAKGTCYVYAFAQNGVKKSVKVTVK